MKKILLLVVVVVMFSCSPKYDGKGVIDSEGNIYMLEHRFGDCYFINELTPKGHKKLIKFRDNMLKNHKKSVK